MIALIVLAMAAGPIVERVGEKYIADAPMEVQRVEIAEEDLDVLQTRVDDFFDRVADGEASEDLVVTEDELNALFQDEMDDEDIVVHLELEDDSIVAEMSFRLPNDFGIGPLRRFAGRYINGKAALDVALNGDELNIEVTSFYIGGEEVPGWITDRFRESIPIDKVLQDSDVPDYIRGLESFRVEDGKITLEPKVSEEK